MPRLPHYTPSGRTTLLFPVLAIVALGLGVALAWPYQALITWVPFIYINAIVYLVFGFGIAVLAMLPTKIGRNRNRVLGAVVGVVIGAGAIGGSHYFAYRRAVAAVVSEVAQTGASNADDVAAEVDHALTFGAYVEAVASIRAT